MSAPLSEQQLAEIRGLIGAAQPATDGLIASCAKAVADMRGHDHTTQREDWFCMNLAAYMGEHAGPVLRRLLDAEARVAELEQQGACRPAEVLAEAAGLIEAWQHDADDTAALDHGALTDTETAAHIAVHRAAKHLRDLAGEPDPTDPPEYRYCGAILVGRTEWPRTCHRRIGHDGPCGPQTDAAGGESRG